MNKQTAFFIISVAAAAAAMLLSYWPLADITGLSPEELGGLAGIVAIAFTSEALAFHFGGAHKVTASLSFLPFLASVILFPLPPAVVAVALTVLLSNLYPVRRPFLKALFNVSQAALATGVGATFYHMAGGTDGDLAPMAFLVLVFAFFTTNLTLTGIAVALLRSEKLGRVFREMLGPKGSNIAFDILASPVALFLVMLYQAMGLAGLLIVVLPLLLLRTAYINVHKLQQSNRDLLHVLIKAIETRDPYTSGHSLRVASLAHRIAEDLGLSERRVDVVEEAAMLHDIGKIDPAFSLVISKPHNLTPEERTLIMTHASKGAVLLEELTSIRAEVIDAVRHHHEKYDGSGYPDGLFGEEIPLPARIIMLCDSIDAMLSDRPYRRALPIDVVEAELKRCAGTQFDPAIVAVVLEKGTLRRAQEQAATARRTDANVDAAPEMLLSAV